MELRHLRYFVAVAEEQNVTRAAARLHVSQPPLSRQIRDLEYELGVALFEHGAKSLRLTEAGQVFLNEARAVLLRCEQAVQTVKAVASGQKGEIRVGFAPSLTVEILPKALRSFQEASPGVRVQLHDLSTQEMLRGLRENKLDVALMVRISPKVLAEFEFEEIRGYGVAVAMHPAHPLARVRKLTLEHLINERLIAYTLTDYPDYHALLADLFAGLPHPPKISEEHESSTSLIASIEAGRGIALVLDSFKCLVGPRVKIRNLTPAPKPLIVGVAHRKGTTSAAVQSFVKAAKCADTEK